VLRATRGTVGASSQTAKPPRPARSKRRRPVSLLSLRILAINVLALIVLGVGVLYLGRYQDRLIQSELASLRGEARLFAGSLAEAGTVRDIELRYRLEPAKARAQLRRLVEITGIRTRLYDRTGGLVGDSHQLGGQGGYIIEIEPLSPPRTEIGWLDRAFDWIDRTIDAWPGRSLLPLWQDQASIADQMGQALEGNIAGALWHDADGHLVLSAAAPVASFREILGAVVLTKNGAVIDESLRQVRLDIAKVFGVALAITVLLSLYLSGAIGRPIRRLATAAERVRHGLGRAQAIPDFTRRGDEIGDLSAALRDMTQALTDRMDATERFAADVAHELKNPLTSAKSAIETATRVEDPAQRARLLQIVQHDLTRLDRLISDISSASRLDAELAREQSKPVDLTAMLQALVEVHESTREGEAPRLALSAPAAPLVVRGIDTRLFQVFQNLVGNALSFTPEAGEVRVEARRDGSHALVAVEDDGPGIPPGKFEKIFERFYSERPKGERFGQHSGLGLSITKQIVEALGGHIVASNRTAADGGVQGARFTVRLPLA
jgi:two-component system, OmpR family, sensor histidine kinase ChvG